MGALSDKGVLYYPVEVLKDGELRQQYIPEARCG